MNKEILAELRKVEQELAKLSKLKATKTTKQRQLKLTRRKVALQGQLQKPKEEIKPQKAKAASSEVTATSGGSASSSKVPEIKKAKKPKGKSKKKKQGKKKKSTSQTEPLKTVPFGTAPQAGEAQVSAPMSLVSMLVLGVVDRIRAALEGRSSLVTVENGKAEWRGNVISVYSYYSALETATRSTVLLKICDEAEKEAEKFNAGDKEALRQWDEGTTISNILVNNKDTILDRLYAWVFDSDRKVEDLSDIDALFPFTEAFGGTKYEAELKTALDEAANEDMNGGIEREEYDPKNTFIGWITGREYVILPDESIQQVSDKLILFEKGSDGLYEIGSKKYTLKEAIERL